MERNMEVQIDGSALKLTVDGRVYNGEVLSYPNGVRIISMESPFYENVDPDVAFSLIRERVKEHNGI